jgi:soluble P-type ATPase
LTKKPECGLIIATMMRIEIPDFGPVEIEHLVSDYSGTLSEDGKIVPGVNELLNKLSDELTVHVLTSDTFGMAVKELEGVNCTMNVLDGKRHDLQKEEYVKSLGPNKVAALGNGRNDRRMLKAARVGITVCLKEGCSVEALMAGDVLVASATDALELLIHPKRIIATLRS